MRKITEIVIHCSATRPDWMEGHSATEKRDEIDRWHKARKWRGIGYHAILDRDGAFAPGREVEDMGAHVKGHNRETIGVCLIGGHGAAAHDAFPDHFTDAQAGALLAFVEAWREDDPEIIVSGHNEYAAKGCPGFDVAGWLKGHGIDARPQPAPQIVSDPAPSAPAWLLRPPVRRRARA